MALSDSAGLLFKIKGDASDAIRALNQTQREAKDLTGTTTSLSSGFASLAAPAAIAGAAIAAVGVAAIAATQAVYSMTKSAAEFGSEIFDASEKTGLTARTLSAMKFAADQSGASLDTVTNATARFSRVIGEAGNGSEQAQAKLARLGVTSTDLDKALSQALATIVKVPPGAQQMALAMEAFGRSGADLLPFIKSFDGDLEALTERAKALGVTIDDEAARAADEFGDQLDTLNAQIDGVSRTIGNAFMPIFLDMARSLSEFFARNQGEIQQWGQNAANIVRGFMVTLEDFNRVTTNVTNSSAAAWLGWANKILIILNPVALALQTILRYMGAVGAANSQLSIGDLRQADDTRSFTPAISSGIPRSVGGGRARAGGGRSEADRAAELAARLAERDLVAQIRLETENLKTIQEQGVKTYEEIRKKLGEGASIVAFLKETNDQTANWQDNLKRSLTLLEALENQAQKADATEHERALLRQKQEERRQKLVDDGLKENERNEKALHDARTKRWEERLEQGAREAELAQRYFNEEMDREEERARVLGLNRGEGIGGITLPEIDLTELLPEESVFDLWTESWNAFADAIELRSGDVATSLETLGDIFQDAFGGMANALASAVEQWVLYGETGPAVLRKVLASALASIAAEAAVQAIYATALGFIRLAQWDFAAAANAFTSAAIFASVAGVAALAGRAIAGDAFKKQATAATGGSTSSGSRSTDAQGTAYSPYSDKPYIQEEGRSSPLGVRVEMVVNDKSGMFDKLFETSWRANGRIRRLVEDGR